MAVYQVRSHASGDTDGLGRQHGVHRKLLGRGAGTYVVVAREPDGTMYWQIREVSSERIGDEGGAHPSSLQRRHLLQYPDVAAIITEERGRGDGKRLDPETSELPRGS